MNSIYGTSKMKTETRIIAELQATRPDVVITVTREIDPYCVWDGDAPDPTDDGFEPYTVSVRATTVRNGRFFEGESTLGSSWYRPEEPINDIHGYFRQMLDEALAELDSVLKERA